MKPLIPYHTAAFLSTKKLRNGKIFRPSDRMSWAFVIDAEVVRLREKGKE
jgi:hypothetical protein